MEDGGEMLVLTRNLDETIMIGDNVQIKVLNVNRNQVKLGLEAPKEVKIYRLEIYPGVWPEGGKCGARKESYAARRYGAVRKPSEEIARDERLEANRHEAGRYASGQPGEGIYPGEKPGEEIYPSEKPGEKPGEETYPQEIPDPTEIPEEEINYNV